MGPQALYSSAINGVGAMPAKGGHSQLSKDEVKKAVDYIIVQVSDAKVSPTKGATAGTGQGASPEGKATYQAMCSSCHDSGVLGAPMVTDKGAWKARVAMGPQALYSSAINGVGAMPAKGGHPQLSADEVKLAVDYMLNAVQ